MSHTKGKTALKILKELNASERENIVFNTLSNPAKKKEVKKALKELKAILNSHDPLLEACERGHQRLLEMGQRKSHRTVSILADAIAMVKKEE